MKEQVYKLGEFTAYQEGEQYYIECKGQRIVEVTDRKIAKDVICILMIFLNNPKLTIDYIIDIFSFFREQGGIFYQRSFFFV